MKKAAAIFLIIVITFYTTAASFGESTGEQVSPKSSFSVGGVSFSPGNEYSMVKNEDDSIELYHKDGMFSVVVSYDQMDERTLELLRKYYNDYSSDENYMFDKFTEYRKSFFSAMEELFHTEFLYPEINQPQESNMKIFGRYVENNLSESSYSVLYNTIYSDKTESIEQIHINIDIPISSEKIVYSIGFTCEKGTLDDAVMKDMLSFINSMKIPGLKDRAKTLNIFRDPVSIKLANQGIYPDLEAINIVYSNFINKNFGYSIKYPSSFVQYRLNNVTDTMDYTSFKINFNHTISISAEKLMYISPSATDRLIGDRLDVLKNTNSGKLSVDEEGILNTNKRKFNYIKYEISSSKGSTYIQDYFIIHGSNLYNIKLKSCFMRPTAVIERELYNMLLSLEFADNNLIYSIPSTHASVRFTNKEEGYTFLYPEEWILMEDTSSDINHDAFIVKSPDNSSLEVLIAESQLSENVLQSDIVLLAAQEDSFIFKRLFKGYRAPYMDKAFAVLQTSSYESEGIVFIKRLVNYLDSADRNRMCYSVDIIRGRDVYSLFISSADYISSIDSKEYQEEIAAAASIISNSFGLKNTPEYLKRVEENETRNRKVVLVENYLKGLFGEKTVISSPTRFNSTGDIFVKVNGVKESGFYVLKVDNIGGKVELKKRVLKSEILYSESEKLRQRYDRRAIESVNINAENMTIDIVYFDNMLSQNITRTYQVDTYMEGDSLKWLTVRKNLPTSLQNDCALFLSGLLKTDIKGHFSNIDAFESAGIKENKYFVPVYLEFNNTSGYFVLSIDPADDSITAVYYIPVEDVIKDIESCLISSNYEYSVVGIHINPADKFEYEILLKSKNDGLLITGKMKLVLDVDTLILIPI